MIDLDLDTKLYASALAKFRGVTLRSAERMLAKLEARHGARVVRRDRGRGSTGERRWTTKRRLLLLLLDDECDANAA